MTTRKRYEYRGQYKSTAEYAEQYSIKVKTLRSRIARGKAKGLTCKQSLIAAIECDFMGAETWDYHGTQMTLIQLAMLHDIPASIIGQRLRRGVDIDVAIRSPVRSEEPRRTVSGTWPKILQLGDNTIH